MLCCKSRVFIISFFIEERIRRKVPGVRSFELTCISLALKEDSGAFVRSDIISLIFREHTAKGINASGGDQSIDPFSVASRSSEGQAKVAGQ